MDGEHTHPEYERQLAELETRVTELEEGAPPPVEPPPVEPPPVQPPDTGHKHFDTEKVKPGVFLSNSLRSDEEIRRWDVGNNRSVFDYDADLDYAVCNEPTSSLGTAQQMHAFFGRSFASADEFWCQWEALFFEDMLQVTQQTHKAYRWDGSNNGRWELQHRYSRTTATAVAMPTIRSYSGSAEGGNTDPVREIITDVCSGMGNYNWQPGGDCLHPYSKNMGAEDHMAADRCYNPFVIRADVRHRITMSRKDEELKMWMQSADDPQAYLVIRRTWPGLSPYDMMRFQFNSSQGGAGPTHVAVRNAIYSTEPIAF